MDLEQTIMSLIVFGGNAKSDAMLAIDSAKKGDFAQADEQIAQAEQALLEAHHSKQNLYKVKHVAKKQKFPFYSFTHKTT